MGFFVWGDFIFGGGEGLILFIFFPWKMRLTVILIKKKKTNTTTKPKQYGFDPLVALSLPLYVVTSMPINTDLQARQKGYEVNMEIPVGFKLCKLLTFRYF